MNERVKGRLPAERGSPLSPRTASLLVQLRPPQPLPARYRIHRLALDVQWGLPVGVTEWGPLPQMEDETGERLLHHRR